MNRFLPLVFLLILMSCHREEPVIDFTPSTAHNNRVPLIWNQLYLEVERFTPGYKPPVSARNLAYINLSAYEAVVQGSEFKYRSLSSHFPGLETVEIDPDTEYNWSVCAHAAYAKAFELFFPTAPSQQQFQMLDVNHDLQSELEIGLDPVIFQASYEYGQKVAQAVYEWSMTDAWGHVGYLRNNDPGYFPPGGEGLWKPTYPDFTPALLPHWGKVRTFAALEEDVVSPPPVFDLSPTSQLSQEARMTYDWVNRIKAGQDEESYWIAEFWSDDCPILTFSPAGRWISITNQVLAAERMDLMETIVTYAKVSLALGDAGITCWREKYRYNCLRPVDFIHNYMDDPGWNTVMCPDGSGGYYTPNFPTYPSGHATFSGAAATVLANIFGQEYQFTDRSHEGRTEFRSKPRTFGSFQAMAEENALSRVPLGVHFLVDSEAGLDLGHRVGSRVLSLPWK